MTRRILKAIARWKSMVKSLRFTFLKKANTRVKSLMESSTFLVSVATAFITTKTVATENLTPVTVMFLPLTDGLNSTNAFKDTAFQGSSCSSKNGRGQRILEDEHTQTILLIFSLFFLFSA